MLSSKHFAVSALAALALGLAFSDPALSASTGVTLSAKWASAPHLHQGDLCSVALRWSIDDRRYDQR
jgi:hypothetical protein